MINGHRAGGSLLAVLANRRREFDVVTLPDGRGLARIDQRGGDAVDGRAIVVLALQAIAVENLHFVASLDIDAAVAPALALGLWHVGHAKFDVQLEFAFEFLLGDDVAGPVDFHDAAVEQLPPGLFLTITRLTQLSRFLPSKRAIAPL